MGMTAVFGQNNFEYWQQHVDYEMDVKMDVNSFNYGGSFGGRVRVELSGKFAHLVNGVYVRTDVHLDSVPGAQAVYTKDGTLHPSSACWLGIYLGGFQGEKVVDPGRSCALCGLVRACACIRKGYSASGGCANVGGARE